MVICPTFRCDPSILFSSFLYFSPSFPSTQPDLLLSTLSMLFDADKDKVTDVLTRQCMSRDQCFLLYQQNVVPVVIRLIHDPPCAMYAGPSGRRERAGRVLFQLVTCQPDDKRGRREGRVLRWLEELRAYSAAIIFPDESRQNRRIDGKISENQLNLKSILSCF